MCGLDPSVRLTRGVAFISVSGSAELYVPKAGARYHSHSLGGSKLFQLLRLLSDWTPKSAAIQFLTRQRDIGNTEATRAIADLLRSQILEESVAPAEEEAAHLWTQRGWVAPLLYHQQSCDVPRLNYDTDAGHALDVEIMRRYLAEEKAPPLYKEYPNKPTVQLPSVRKSVDSNFEAARTCKPVHTKSSKLSLTELTQLCFFSFGEIGALKFPVTGPQIRKAVPSGGARHPTELYLFALDVDELPSGLYHYNVRQHSLEVLSPQEHWEAIQREVICTPNWLSFRPRAVLVLTSVVDRSMYRYREPHSYRVLHFDVGHLLQSVAGVAASLNRQTLRLYSFHDSNVERLLGVDSITEPALAAIVVG